MAATQVNTKYVKLYDEQGLPLGFKGYSEVQATIGNAIVKLYDGDGEFLGVSKSISHQFIILLPSGVQYGALENNESIEIPYDVLSDWDGFDLRITHVNDYSDISITNGVLTGEIGEQDGDIILNIAFDESAPFDIVIQGTIDDEDFLLTIGII